MKVDECFALLGLVPEASQEEVRKAYYALAKRFHPDCNPGDSEAECKLAAVNEAYSILQKASSVHYHTLGLEPGASISAVQRAYSVLSERYHPSQFSGIEDVHERERMNSRLEAIRNAFSHLTATENDNTSDVDADDGGW